MASGVLTAATLTLGLWCVSAAPVEAVRGHVTPRPADSHKGDGQQGCGRGQATGNPHCKARRCQLSATPINFGAYDVFDTQALDSAGEITVSCTGSGVVRVSLNAGSFGTFQTRTLRSTSGTDSMRYQVFLDQARQLVFGDGSSGTAVATLSNPQPATIRLYARLAPLQMVHAGDYADGLLATFTF